MAEWPPHQRHGAAPQARWRLPPHRAHADSRQSLEPSAPPDHQGMGAEPPLGPHLGGVGPGRSSSDAAYDLNLAREQAKLAGWDTAEVALDLWKAYEMVTPEAQLVEARALGFPLRLTWMLLSTYRQPRTLAAYDTMSRAVVSWQGNIAGCGHANSLLLVLTLRALRRAHEIAPTVQPRGLVDDVTLAWTGPSTGRSDDLGKALCSFTDSVAELQLVLQPQKSGFLASSRRRALQLRPAMRRRGLQEKTWVRNLGHELHGRKVLRTQEKRRLATLMDRRRRIAMLRRAAGRRAAALVASGLSPSAGHGAGVAGLADRPLAQLRTIAAVTAGPRRDAAQRQSCSCRSVWTTTRYTRPRFPLS